MPLACIFCEADIAPEHAATRCCDGPCHLRCWQEAEETRRAWIAECEDTEGRAYEQYVASLRDRVPLKRAAGSAGIPNVEKGRVA